MPHNAGPNEDVHGFRLVVLFLSGETLKFELFRSSAERNGAVPGSAEHLEG